MNAIDPRSVKAGDTVTLTRGKASHTGVVIGLPNWGYVLDTGAKQHDDYYSAHTDYISDDEAWALTAHQPAPEPEPKWEPGTVAEATVRGARGIRVIRATNTGGSDPHEMDPTWISADLVDRGQKVNGYDGTYLHHDDDVTDARPLVVIDPATVDVDRLVEDYQGAYIDTEGHGYDGHHRRTIAMRAALSHLGIEAP